MTLELYINGTLRRIWLYDDFQAGYSQLYHEARREYIDDKIAELKQQDAICSLIYTAQYYEFCVVIKSRPKAVDENEIDLLTEKI